MHCHGFHTTKNGQGKDIFKITMQGKFNKRIVIKCYGPDYKTVDSNLKAFCANNVYFFDSSYRKTKLQISITVLNPNSINLHVPKDAS